MTTPVVSIVMAARNEGQSVRKTVDSITENSSEVSYEIVLIDDGNFDGSFDFLKEEPYLNDPRVRSYRFEKQMGCIRTRHQGVRLARGRYVLFLDAHMCVPEGWLTRMLQAIKRAGSRAAITPNVSALDPDTWALKEPYRHYLYIDAMFQFEWKSSLHPGNLLPTAGGACVMMERNFYLEVGGFDLGLRRWGCEFVDLILKVYSAGGVCVFEPQVVVGHLYRTAFPYIVSWTDVTYNTLRVGYVHLSQKTFPNFLAKVSTMPGFAESMAALVDNLPELESLRHRQLRTLRRHPDWFVETFLPALLETPKQSAPQADVWQERLERSRGPTRPVPRIKTSILMPVRNEGSALKRTVELLFESTEMEDLELWILDDASRDGCTDFLSEPRWQTERRVRLIQHETPRGYVALLNEGAHLASGQVLKFLDAHHTFSPYWLENLCSAYMEHQGEAIIGCLVTSLDPETWLSSGPPSYGFAPDDAMSAFHHVGVQDLSVDRRVPLLGRYQVMVGREVFDALGGLSEDFKGHGYDDFDFCFKAAKRGIPAVIEPSVRLGHLPKETFINKVTWADLVFNRLLLAHRYGSEGAVGRLKEVLRPDPGFKEGWLRFEQRLQQGK